MSALAERVRELSAHPPLSEISAVDRAELEREASAAEAVEDLPGRWQAALLEAEARAAGEEPAGGHGGCHHCH